MRSTIILVSAFGRDPMPSAFFFPKTNILEHSHAQILTCLPFHHPLIRLIILNLYEFSLQCLCFRISVFKLCLVCWCFTIFKATGMSCPLYFLLSLWWLILPMWDCYDLTKGVGMISTLSEEFHTSENITMQNISQNEVFSCNILTFSCGWLNNVTQML